MHIQVCKPRRLIGAMIRCLVPFSGTQSLTLWVCRLVSTDMIWHTGNVANQILFLHVALQQRNIFHTFPFLVIHAKTFVTKSYKYTKIKEFKIPVHKFPQKIIKYNITSMWHNEQENMKFIFSSILPKSHFLCLFQWSYSKENIDVYVCHVWC